MCVIKQLQNADTTEMQLAVVCNQKSVLQSCISRLSNNTHTLAGASAGPIQQRISPSQAESLIISITSTVIVILQQQQMRAPTVTLFKYQIRQYVP